METFPDTITREYCQQVIEKGQLNLLLKTRDKFTKQILEALNNLSKRVTLVFPDEMWDSNRKKIASELLERFGEIHMKTYNNICTIESLTIDKDDIPNNLSSLVIELDK